MLNDFIEISSNTLSTDHNYVGKLSELFPPEVVLSKELTS